MAEEVTHILEQRGVSAQQTIGVAPKLALPIIEESSLEDDPDIQKLWNHLLANAMDPNFNDEIRYGFIDMIKGITGIEAKIIDGFYASLKKSGNTEPLESLYEYSIKKEQLISNLSISSDQYVLAANNLMRMQLIGPAVLTGGISMGSEPVTIYKGIDAIVLTPLGVKFVEACIR